MQHLRRLASSIASVTAFFGLLQVAIASPLGAQILPLSTGSTKRKAETPKALGDPQVKTSTDTAKCECTSETSVTVFLDGSIKGDPKSKGETPTTNGSLAIAVGNAKWDAVASINVAASGDTSRAAFGRGLLVPGNGGFTAGYFEARRLIDILPGVYLRGYLSASSFTWKIPASVGATDSVGVGANAIGAGAGISWQLLGGSVPQKPTGDGEGEKLTPVGARLDVSLIRRALHGDIMSDSFTPVRSAVFDERNVFVGFEIGATLLYNNVRGSIVFYSFPNARSVAGLTKGQVTAGFAIAAPILEGKLR